MAIESDPNSGRVVLTGLDAEAFLRQIKEPQPVAAKEAMDRAQILMDAWNASGGFVRFRPLKRRHRISLFEAKVSEWERRQR